MLVKLCNVCQTFGKFIFQADLREQAPEHLKPKTLARSVKKMF